VITCPDEPSATPDEEIATDPLAPLNKSMLPLLAAITAMSEVEPAPTSMLDKDDVPASSLTEPDAPVELLPL
jgi:hypothetical protein